MSKEPLYIVKVTIPYFYGVSHHSIEYFMSKEKAEKKFQKEKEKLLKKFSDKYTDVRRTENKFILFNGLGSQYAEISLTETEVNVD